MTFRRLCNIHTSNQKTNREVKSETEYTIHKTCKRESIRMASASGIRHYRTEMIGVIQLQANYRDVLLFMIPGPSYSCNTKAKSSINVGEPSRRDFDELEDHGPHWGPL